MCKYCNNLKKDDIVYSTKLVAQATAQFSLENCAVIENSAYFVTVHVEKISDIGKVKNLIQIKIRKAFNFVDEKLEDRIAMIVSGDLSGSRNNCIDDVANKSPHMHALIVLSQRVTDEFRNDHESICERIKNEILRIREVKKVAEHLGKTTQSYSRVVDVRKFDSSERE